MAADKHLDPAALAQEQPRRRSISFVVAIAVPHVRLHARAVDAIPPGCDDAPAFVLLHGVGHGADANCHVGIGAVPAFEYRQVLIATADRSQARRVTDNRQKLTATNLELEEGGTLAARRSGWSARQSR